MAKMVEDAGFESCWAAETTNSAFVTAQIAIQTHQQDQGRARRSLWRSPGRRRSRRWRPGPRRAVRRPVHPRPRHPGEAREREPLLGPVRAPGPQAEGVRPGDADGLLGRQPRRGRHVRGPLLQRSRCRSFGEPPSAAPRDVPIYFAAVNKLMARYCGEVADGLLGHPLASPQYLARGHQAGDSRGGREERAASRRSATSRLRR